MFRNFSAAIFRRHTRNPVWTVVNVSGLAVGLACTLLIHRYVQNEQAVDSIFPDADRIHRIDSEWSDASMGLPFTTLAPVGETLVDQFPEFEASARLYLMTNTVRVREKSFREDVMMADPSVLDLFDIPITLGETSQALKQPRSVVLTERAALRYFGSNDVLGRTIEIETWNRGPQPYTITAVRESLPYNSVTWFGTNDSEYDLIISPEPFGDFFGEDGWNGWQSRFIMQFVSLSPGTGIEQVRSHLDTTIERFAPAEFHDNLDLALSPLRSLYLEHAGGERRRTIRLLILLTALILGLAVINYSNLSSAVALRRAHEVGVRMSIGATRRGIFGQVLGESLAVACLAGLIGAVIAWMVRDAPFTLTGAHPVLDGMWTGSAVAGLLLATMLAGLGGGLYPAFVMSSFEPGAALKGLADRSGRIGAFRSILVVVQFSAAIVLLITSGIMWQQMRFVSERDLGFQREGILTIESVPRQFDDAGIDRMRRVAREMERLPAVRSASLSWRTAAEGGDTRAIHPVGASAESAISLPVAITDEAFARTFGLKMVAGRFFSEDGAAGIVLNESAVRALGWESDAVGRKLLVWNSARPGEGEPPPAPRTVIGVVADYHYASLHEAVGPLAIVSVHDDPLYRVLSLRLDANAASNALASIERRWNDMLPGTPFETTFIEDRVTQLYGTDLRTGHMVALGALVAVILSCLGILGLSAVMVVRRTREVGIRKAVGASVPSVALLLMRDFTRPVVWGIVVAAPVAWILARRWLDGFAYRIEPAPGMFVGAAAIALLLAVGTTAVHAIRTARTNPAETLRSE